MPVPLNSMDIRAALKQGITQLREARVPSFTLAAELLLLHVLGRDRTWLYAHAEESIVGADAQRFLSLIARRAAGEPTQYLTGKQEFWGLEFEVTPDVLIPRPETEHVIEVALDRLALNEIRHGRPQATKGEGLLIADIGTGSGCVAVALAKELPASRIYATDSSAKALEVARRNAVRHHVADRIEFVRANFLEPCSVGTQLYPERSQGNTASQLGTVSNNALSGFHESPVTSHESLRFDLIASNPPYIGRREAASLPREVREHEPATALYGGEEGYELYGELIAQSAKHLKPGGILVLDLGHDSLPAVRPLLDGAQWANIAASNDLAGIPRVIAAQKS